MMTGRNDAQVPTDGSSSLIEQPAVSSLSQQCSVVIVPYNHEEYIEPCVESVLECDPKEVLVVDGGSTDGTRELVREMPGPVELLTVEGNPGYGGCNNVGVERASGEYVLILNPDTRLEEGAIDRLLGALGPPDAGPTVTVPKILTYDGSEINTIGNINHVTGLAFVQGFESPPDEWSEPASLTALSGACFAIRKDDFERVGGFDDSIFLYMEDVEFSWRLNAFGDEIRYVPDAVVYHDYEEVAVSEGKLKHLETGRYIILKKYLSRDAALKLLPSLLMTELLTLGYALRFGTGGVRGKLEALQSAMQTDVEPVHVDTERLVGALDDEIPVDQLGDSLPAVLVQRFANLVFRLNVSLIGD